MLFVGPSDQKYVVPGFYAADGNAAVTGAESGDKWRVHFSADEAGEWSYRVRFMKGAGVALADKPQGESGGFMDGMKGSFEIGPADGPGNGFYSKGRLQYVGRALSAIRRDGRVLPQGRRRRAGEPLRLRGLRRDAERGQSSQDLGAAPEGLQLRRG